MLHPRCPFSVSSPLFYRPTYLYPYRLYYFGHLSIPSQCYTIPSITFHSISQYFLSPVSTHATLNPLSSHPQYHSTFTVPLLSPPHLCFTPPTPIKLHPTPLHCPYHITLPHSSTNFAIQFPTILHSKYSTEVTL